MERRIKVDGDRALLTEEVGETRPPAAAVPARGRALARTGVSGAEPSLPAYASAYSAPRLAFSGKSRSHDTTDATTPDLNSPVFFPHETRTWLARRRQPKPKEKDCGTSAEHRRIS